jgi:hypothetical protein
MPIERANTAYDPQDRRSRDFSAPPRGNDRPMLTPPPKPGVSGGLLAWVIFCAALSVFMISCLIMYFS